MNTLCALMGTLWATLGLAFAGVVLSGTLTLVALRALRRRRRRQRIVARLDACAVARIDAIARRG